MNVTEYTPRDLIEVVVGHRSAATLPISEVLVENILRVYYQATPAQWGEGMMWYAVMRARCQTLAHETGYSLEVVCGLAAAYSPRVGVAYAWTLTERAARSGVSSGHTTHQVRCGTRILAGESPLDVLGRKTSAYYLAMATGGAAEETCTIDSWQHKVLYGPLAGARVAPGWYAYYVACHVEAARRVRSYGVAITVSQLQAVTWVTMRGSAW